MSVLTILFTVVLLIVTFVYFYFKRAFNYWRNKGVEQVPATIPFGSASSALTRKTTLGELFQQVYEKYKPQKLSYVGFYLFAKPVLVPLDIPLIKAILTKDFQHFTDHGDHADEEREPLTGTLFALKGQKWKNLRAKLTPTFTSGKMKMMFHTLVECSNGLKELMDDFDKIGDTFEIKDAVARYTTDVIGSCAFGLDCNSLKNSDSDFRKFGKRIFDVSLLQSLSRFLSIVSPKLTAFLGLKHIRPDVSEFIMDVVTKTIEYREKNNVIRNDFMHLLIQLKNNVELNDEKDSDKLSNDSSSSKDGLTVEQIAAQVLVFFIAGFETSSTTLAFCFFELVTNADIQRKLRDEVRATLEQHGNTLTYEAITGMPYMDKCIQETLRKYPPLPILFRECTESYTIPESGVLIEKGVRVFIPILGIQRDPEFYPKPEQFDPERFSAENKAKREHFAWLPFGEGPRACIGLRFGLMQTKVALAVLLRDYEFCLSDKTEAPLVMNTKNVILSAKGGIWLNVKKIK